MKNQSTWSETCVFPGVDGAGHKEALVFIPKFTYSFLLFGLLFTGVTVLFNYPRVLWAPSGPSFHLYSSCSTDEGNEKYLLTSTNTFSWMVSVSLLSLFRPLYVRGLYSGLLCCFAVYSLAPVWKLPLSEVTAVAGLMYTTDTPYLGHRFNS